jgi:hypothetical protein
MPINGEQEIEQSMVDCKPTYQHSSKTNRNMRGVWGGVYNNTEPTPEDTERPEG